MLSVLTERMRGSGVGRGRGEEGGGEGRVAPMYQYREDALLAGMKGPYPGPLRHGGRAALGPLSGPCLCHTDTHPGPSGCQDGPGPLPSSNSS